MTTARSGVAFVLVLSALTASCGRLGDRPASSSGPETPDLPPVVLPDLSLLSNSVRQQVNDQYQAFVQKAANTALSPGERAESYGDLGELQIGRAHV